MHNAIKVMPIWEEPTLCNVLSVIVFIQTVCGKSRPLCCLCCVILIVNFGVSCSFPIWCLGEDMEYDCMGSWLLHFHLLGDYNPLTNQWSKQNVIIINSYSKRSNSKFLDLASIGIILPRQRTIKALIRLRGCTFVVRIWQKKKKGFLVTWLN